MLWFNINRSYCGETLDVKLFFLAFSFAFPIGYSNPSFIFVGEEEKKNRVAAELSPLCSETNRSRYHIILHEGYRRTIGRPTDSLSRRRKRRNLSHKRGMLISRHYHEHIAFMLIPNLQLISMKKNVMQWMLNFGTMELTATEVWAFSCKWTGACGRRISGDESRALCRDRSKDTLGMIRCSNSAMMRNIETKIAVAAKPKEMALMDVT